MRSICILSVLLLGACGPNESNRIELAEKSAVDCLYKVCDGDVEPTKNSGEIVLKLNGLWYAGPQEYFTSFGVKPIYWWNHKPVLFDEAAPLEMKKMAKEGKAYDLMVEIFLRSSNIPPEPRGYKFIELAEREGWVDRREMPRPGLESITMKNVISPTGYSIDHVTYYVATQLKGADGLPPVATCAHKYANGSGGTGFMWQSGIWVGTRMSEKHCIDWPEIYLEVTRILQLLRRV